MRLRIRAFFSPFTYDTQCFLGRCTSSSPISTRGAIALLAATYFLTKPISKILDTRVRDITALKENIEYNKQTAKKELITLPLEFRKKADAFFEKQSQLLFHEITNLAEEDTLNKVRGIAFATLAGLGFILNNDSLATTGLSVAAFAEFLQAIRSGFTRFSDPILQSKAQILEYSAKRAIKEIGKNQLI